MESQSESTGHHGRPYLRFGAMIAASTAAMLGLKYLSTYELDHVYWSETRFYMALLMGAAMAVIMLSFMLHMHKSRGINLGIYIGSAFLFALALYLVRSQETVQDVAYMRAMIPHHSIAILTSQRAEISDPRVRKLANEIIEAQRREIDQMKHLIADLTSTEEKDIEIVPAAKQHTDQEKKKSKGQESGQKLPKVPEPDPASAKVPEGFRVEVVVEGLIYPTSIDFDPAGNMYIAEAGYSYGDPKPEPRILRVGLDGNIQTLLEGKPLHGPVNDLLWWDDRLFVSHRGKVSVLLKGVMLDLVTGLPSDGDHHNNQLTVGPDRKIYFGQGTATNSGVVGIDNYKMGWLKDNPKFHDMPPRDLKLVGLAFESSNPLTHSEEMVVTSAFHPFTQAAPEGSVVDGRTRASGTVLRMNPDGSELEVYAWGLRNPFGLLWAPEGVLYATENGFDVRGSRPIANDKEDIYIIKQDAWYGWPDFAMGRPVTDPHFKPEGKPHPHFLLAEHPPVEQPWLTFPKHSSITKLDVAPTEPFGKGWLFVSFFGHMAPMTGEAPEEHGGHRVVRINPATKAVETFFSQKSHGAQQHESDGHGASHQGGEQHKDAHGGGHAEDESVSAGPRRLMDVRFSPDGKSLYIVDFGAMVVRDKPLPVPGSGVVWRVLPDSATGTSGPPSNLRAP